MFSIFNRHAHTGALHDASAAQPQPGPKQGHQKAPDLPAGGSGLSRRRELVRSGLAMRDKMLRKLGVNRNAAPQNSPLTSDDVSGTRTTKDSVPENTRQVLRHRPQISPPASVASPQVAQFEGPAAERERDFSDLGYDLGQAMREADRPDGFKARD